MTRQHRWATPVAAAALVVLAGCSGGGSDVQPLTDHAPRSSASSAGAETTAGGGLDRAPVGGLAQADSQTPASGVCTRPSTDPLVTITVNPDTPVPRCATVSKDQGLKVVNASDNFNQDGTTVTVRFANLPPRVLKIGASTTFRRHFGGYLAAGVHILHVSLYGEGGAAIWLRPGNLDPAAPWTLRPVPARESMQ
jgi:hypothetical protein